MDLSASGEAANMEIALLLGLTGERAPQPLRGLLPALAPGAIAMLGPRDHPFRQAANVPTVADRVWLRPAGEVSTDPAGYARAAIEHIVAQAPRWWLHIDLDVLARSEFAACGAPGEIMLAGGLTWRQLTQIGTSAMQGGGCCGWSLAIYNPELDADRSAARHIVEFVYGEMYTKPALSDRDRELGAVVALTSLGRSSQLPQHLRASLDVGITPDQLREAIMLTATIAGFPPAMNAMSTLKSVLAERERDGSAG